MAFYFHVFRQYQWFLPIISDSPENPSINPISTNHGDDAPPISLVTKPIPYPNDLATLWHRRIGNLSLHNIKQMIKHDAFNSLLPLFHYNINICHDCSISKSIHLPVSTPSQNHIWGPGDLVVANLVGPLPISYNNMKYVLIIQDFFSRLMAAIPLCNKTEAKIQFIDWMKQFTTTTSFKIKSIRTNNGSEFRKSTVSAFTTQHGIAHELSIP
ncbi:hypothetical protein O181_053042 [Austropuccinia psidii MF-1]|uniref:Integrase catalytic domain-containing protein n=1 Tax=Austropuccinia psidii MF-1 TaxID=1389203 RepID=A0A9Q3HR52_9BASI|nr:hypothetical protein [Austropuccinia psidii MF-1]